MMGKMAFAFALLALFAISYAGYCAGRNGELGGVIAGGAYRCADLGNAECAVMGCTVVRQVVNDPAGYCTGANQQCGWQDNARACGALGCSWIDPPPEYGDVCGEGDNHGMAPNEKPCALVADEGTCNAAPAGTYCSWVGSCSAIGETPGDGGHCCQGLVVDGAFGDCVCAAGQPANACADVQSNSPAYCVNVMGCQAGDHTCSGGAPLGNSCESATYYAACIESSCCLQMGASCAGNAATGCCPGSTCTNNVCVQPNIVLGQADPFAHPQSAHSGESIVVDAIVRNAGNGASPQGAPITVSAKAQIGAAQETILNAEDASVQPLAAGAQAHAQFTFTCPEVARDAVYAVTVTADTGNAVVESSERDNVLSVGNAFTCMPPVPKPNLLLENVGASPPNAIVGDTVTVRATVRNDGEIPTPPSAPIPVRATVQGIGVREANARPFGQESLAVGASQDVEFQFVCPQVQAPTNFEAEIAVDPDNTISEIGKGDNVAIARFSCEPPHIPNLILEAVDPVVDPSSARSGEQVTINVRVKNLGNFQTPADRQIAIRASSNGIATQTVLIEPMGAISQSGVVSIQLNCPQVQETTQYAVSVAVDPDGRIQESNENDNGLSPEPSFTCQPWGQPNYAFIMAAIILAFAIIALAFMAGYAFDLPHVRASAADELVHLVATAFVLLCVMSFIVALNTVYIPKLAGSAGGNAQVPLLDQAYGKLMDIYNSDAAIFNNMKGVNEKIGKEASKSVYCTFLGAGYTLVSCSTLNMLRGSVVQGLVVSGAAIADISAERLLLKFTQLYAFSVLLPIGLFLHAFKFTRSAGAALISIAIGFYVVYPLTILFCDNMLVGEVVGAGKYFDAGSVSVSQEVTCNPYEQNWDNINAVRGNLAAPSAMEYMVFQTLVRSIFCTIVELMITLAFIRAFASLLGSEIDVSALARIS
ncbi:Uncharacterised protein [Candidatus Anstonella stagnisolia]|nr:Uncharacterised protein [Candidatus Anstonella stagnisolia]